METNKNIQQEAFYMLFTLCFIFVSVFLSSKLLINLFTMSVILIFTIFTFKTKIYEQQIIGTLAYFTLMFTAITNSGYIGLFILILGLFLLSAIFYIYDNEIMFDSEKMSVRRIQKRAGLYLVGFILLIVSSLVVSILSELVGGSFLENGLITGVIFGASVIIENALKKEISNELEINKMPEEYRLRIEQEKEKRNDALVKILSIWLLVIDFSIISYIFTPNNNGFDFVATLICITILFTTFFPGTGKEDLYNVIYNRLRPFQAVALLLLLIAHSDKIFTLFFFYAVIVCFLHVILVLNFINFKTFLTCVVVVYMTPIVGYFSNPIKLIDDKHQTVSSVLLQKADPKTSFWKSDEVEKKTKELAREL